MTKGKVYRSRRSGVTGRPTRYQRYVDFGDRRRTKAKTGGGSRKGWITKLITWLFAADNPARKRRRVSRVRGWNTTQVHPNMYRRNAERPRRAVPDEVAAQRAKRRRRR